MTWTFRKTALNSSARILGILTIKIQKLPYLKKFKSGHSPFSFPKQKPTIDLIKMFNSPIGVKISKKNQYEKGPLKLAKLENQRWSFLTCLNLIDNRS
jgi:hypothetical protein